jgi:hypothetical protein
LINGKITTTKDFGSGTNPDNPNILQVRTENNDTYAKVSVNSAETEEFPITYIHWNATETDTIKAQIKRMPNGGGIWVEKIWIFKNNAWVEQLSGEITFIK